MSDILPTVTVAADNKWGYRIINASAFDPKVHTLYGDAADAPGAPEPGSVPAEWEGLHWKKRIALAKQLTGQDAKNAEQADALIREHIAAAVADVPADEA